MTEVIEGQAVEISNEPAEAPQAQIGGWQGDTPFFLVIEPASADGNIGIDLDQAGWVEANNQHFRRPGVWWLIDKATQSPAMAIVVHDGDQPYFTKHHVGDLMASRELVAYGLGKKCADGTMVRNWLLPGGLIVGGEDVDVIASRMLNR